MPRSKRKARLSRRTRKAVLDTTSFKKRDTMIPVTNLTAAGPSNTYTNSPAIILSNQSSDTSVNHPTVLLWAATARDLTDSNSVANVRQAVSQRTATSCYMRGLGEAIEIQTNSGCPWQWRRICFTYKGALPGATAGTQFGVVRESNTGFGRVLNSVPGNRNAGQTYDLFYLIFRGQNASDWMDPMTAPTDPTRITVKYDKTVSVQAPNEDGCIRKYKRFHPMNTSLVYDDDESGQNMATTYYSTQGKAGMGDYYVVDLIRSRFAATASDQMLFGATATLYWHEK